MIELICVLMIISLLAALSVPSGIGFIKKINENALVSQAQIVRINAQKLIIQEIVNGNAKNNIDKDFTVPDDYPQKNKLENMLSPEIDIRDFSSKYPICIVFEKNNGVYTGDILKVIYPKDNFLIVLEKNKVPIIEKGYDNYNAYT